MIMLSTKRKREAVKPPSEDTWNDHKNLLRGLYFNSTLAKLMEHMERNFHFVASKNQYERKFKEWNFRKNLTSEEWEHVLRKKRKRDENNKETRVVLHGVEVPKKRLRKEESRYTLSDLDKIFSSYPSAPSPEGISVATPPPAMVDLYIRNIRIDNLPSFRLESLFTSQPGPGQLFTPRNGISVPRCTQSIPSSLLSAPSMSASTVAELLGYHGSPSRTSAQNRFDTIVQRLQNSMIEKYEGEAEHRITKLLGSSNEDALQLFITYIAQVGSNNMLGWFQPKKILLWISEQSQRVLESLIELQNPAIQACLEVLIDGYTSFYKQAFTALLSADKNRRLFHGRRENLLHRAIELGLADAVKILVDEGIDVNRKVYSKTPDQHMVPSTLLGLASDTEIAKILIAAGANVNDPIHDIIGGEDEDDAVAEYYSPVYYAARNVKPALFRVLLDAGPHFDPSDVGVLRRNPKSFLALAIDSGDYPMVKILLGLGVECSDSPLIFYNFGQDDSVHRTELQQASYKGNTEIITALLATYSGWKSLYTGQYRWAPLRDAAMRGHMDVVELLVSEGADVNATTQEIEKSADEDDEDDEDDEPKMQLIPSTALMAAVEADDAQMVECLLSHGADINAPAISVYGTGVLAVAEALRNNDVLVTLRDAGASPQRDHQQLICDIQFAAARIDLHKVQEILALGVDPCHILDTSGKIFEMAGGVPGDVLSIFLEVCGSEISCRGPEFGYCALEIAIKLGDVTLIEMLGEAGADFNVKTSEDLSLLQYALSSPLRSSFELIDCLLRYGASTDAPAKLRDNDWVGTPLEIAASEYDDKMLERVFFSDTRQIRNSPNALSSAIRNKGIGISTIQLMLDSGAFVNAWPLRESALGAAVSRQSIEIVTLLLDKGVNMNCFTSADYRSVLQQATASGSYELVERWVHRGAEINIPAADVGGYTALQAAALSGSLGILKLLLYRGANVNADPAPNRGRTALQAAIHRYMPDPGIIQLLIDNGADINAPAAKERGVTALQAAAIRGHLKIALQLLEMGADPNAPGSPRGGRTALEGAAEHGRLDMVQLLLNAGAEPTQSALRYAERHRHFVIADMIKAALQEKEALEPDKGKGKGKDIER
ncbi:ankyrin repeat-containing domain protein [Cadophora sp. MPI-SDFR-AT-0126]|nr:ankyrin repeat-containing domain protein [Leotiomycetes sp. MPI-SDFR-AT-0126]